MKLKNKIAFGLLCQWYEIEMFQEHIDSLIQMMENVENPEMVTFDFCISYQTYLESCEFDVVDLESKFQDQLERLLRFEVKINQQAKFGPNDENGWNDEFYNIASYRRDFNYKYCQTHDLICWSETDSLWPKQTLEILDNLHESVKGQTPKYIFNFADRRLWDNSFAPLHPLYEKIQFREDEEWQFNNPCSGKAYMSLEHMNEINSIPFNEIEIVSFNEPRFDGSCVCFSSDLIKSGVNIPHALIHCSEDVSLGVIAKKLLGDQFVQYNARNILHVHNRRHPKKRSYIKGENNPTGKCTVKDKGEWWKILEDSSKQNFSNLFTQKPFIKMEEVMSWIQKHPHLTENELNELNKNYENNLEI